MAEDLRAGDLVAAKWPGGDLCELWFGAVVGRCRSGIEFATGRKWYSCVLAATDGAVRQEGLPQDRLVRIVVAGPVGGLCDLRSASAASVADAETLARWRYDSLALARRRRSLASIITTTAEKADN